MRVLPPHSRFSLVSSPLGWLLITAVVAAICAVAVSPRVWVIFVCLVMVATIGLIWPWISLRSVRLWLAFSRDRAMEGESVRVTARVENRWLLPAYGLTLRGELGGQESDETEGGGLAARLPYCGGLREIECHWKFIPPQRGEYPLQPPQLATGFPFGLWETHKRAESAPPLIVWPQTFPVGAIPASPADTLLDGWVSRNRAGSEGELLGVRPYRRGDSPRRIHWAQSARHDRLIVCELESLSRPSARILIDLDDSIHTPGSHGSREWAIRIAASFAKGWIESGAEVSLVGDGVEIPMASGVTQTRRILDALAKLAGHSSQTLDQLREAARHRRARRGIDLIVTTDRRIVQAGGRAQGHERWVVMKCAGFASSRLDDAALRRFPVSSGVPSFTHSFTPWLTIESPDQARYALRHGFREAQHGS